MKRLAIYYATRNPFKEEELAVISGEMEFIDVAGSLHRVGELIDFRLSGIATDEPLEIDLEKMVEHKARSAYKALLTPCIVEHAGLILEKHLSKGFPGGLTQPMWDALGPLDFLKRSNSLGERAIARSVVGYCDGRSIRTFIGETAGELVNPAGSREFYWDVIFKPDGGNGRTYASMASAGADGIREKLKLSQSTKALLQFATFLSTVGENTLFPPA